MLDTTNCAECGEPIEPGDDVVLMAEQIEMTPAGSSKRQWRDGLVFRYHVGCAPDELVGEWRRVA